MAETPARKPVKAARPVRRKGADRA